MNSEKDPATWKPGCKTEHTTNLKSQRRGDALNNPGRERRTTGLEIGTEGGGGFEGPGLIVWDLVVYSDAVRIIGNLGGDRHAMTYTLKIPLAAACRKGGGCGHKAEGRHEDQSDLLDPRKHLGLEVWTKNLAKPSTGWHLYHPTPCKLQQSYLHARSHQPETHTPWKHSNQELPINKIQNALLIPNIFSQP